MKHRRERRRVGLPFLGAVLAALLVAGLAVTTFGIRFGSNPLDGATFAKDPTYVGRAQQAADQARSSTQREALERMAGTPTAKWFGTWATVDRVRAEVRSYVSADPASVPMVVLYALPGVDCMASAPSGFDPDTYGRWVREVAEGMKSATRSVVILEPDALAALGTCTSPEGDRTAVLSDAVDVLSSVPGALVYVDAGHSKWQSVDVMAQRLRSVGVDKVRGFSLNVSNTRPNVEVQEYGEALAQTLGRSTHYVVDTSRNGGPALDVSQWCNPTGARLGQSPRVTGNGRQDAALWIKPPGESDGTCNNAPVAGTFWTEGALRLSGL